MPPSESEDILPSNGLLCRLLPPHGCRLTRRGRFSSPAGTEGGFTELGVNTWRTVCREAMLSALRVALLVVSTVVALSYAVLHATSTSSSTSEDDASPSKHALDRTSWLRLHPPRQASHDAELLRRRMLASLVELDPSELAEHVPAIAASLDHEDHHVRALAVAMLGRLEAPAIETHRAEIAARLVHADETVRLAVVRALGRAPTSVLATYAPDLVTQLADEEPAVRWAVVDALSHLEADALAGITLNAVDALVQQNDISIARAAVASWTPKLEAAHPDVISALARVAGVDETRG